MSFWDLFGDTHRILAALTSLEKRIMATQAEHAQNLRDVKTQLDKVKTEILAKVAALETAIANAGMTSAEVDAALTDVRGATQGLDDLNADEAARAKKV